MQYWQRTGKNTYSFKNPYNFRSDLNALTEEEITWAVDYQVEINEKRLYFKNVAHWPVHVCDNKNWSFHIARQMLDSIMNTFNATNINYGSTLECLKAIDNKKRNNKNVNVYDDETCKQMAMHIVPVLSCAGFKSETITFSQLNIQSGLEIGTKIAYPLKFIREYMLRHHLPDIVSIVITKTGEPVKYYKKYTRQQLQEIRNEVFNHDWVNHPIELK